MDSIFIGLLPEIVAADGDGASGGVATLLAHHFAAIGVSRLQHASKVPSYHPLGSARARLLCLLGARLVALGSSALPEWRPGHWAPSHRAGCPS